MRARTLGKQHQRPAPDEPKELWWPRRCGEHVMTLHEELDKADVPSQSAERALSLAAFRLASALDTGKVPDDSTRCSRRPPAPRCPRPYRAR